LNFFNLNEHLPIGDKKIEIKRGESELERGEGRKKEGKREAGSKRERE